MTPTLAAVLLILGLGLLYVFASAVTGALERYRAPRRIRCPERGEPATVHIDPWHAALMSLLFRPPLRVRDCSLWREGERCSAGCRELL